MLLQKKWGPSMGREYTVKRSEWQKLYDALRDVEELLKAQLTERSKIESALERVRQALEVKVK